MLDLKLYWREIRAVASSLPEFVWLVSVENSHREQSGARMVQVESTTAARLLQAKSHRRATEEEIGAHHASDQAAARHAAHQKLRRSGIAVVAVPDCRTPD